MHALLYRFSLGLCLLAAPLVCMSFPVGFASGKTVAVRPAAAPASARADSGVPSQPTSVLFYPDEALVTVEETLKAHPLPDGGTGFILTLPSDAARETFFVSVAGAPAPGAYWQEEDRLPSHPVVAGSLLLPPARDSLVPENEPQPERRALLQLRADLKDQSARIQGNLDAVKWRMALWTAPLEPGNTGNKEKVSLTPEDRAKIDSSLERILPALAATQEKEARALQDASARLEKVEEALREFDQQRAFQVAIVPFAAKEGEAVALRYGYIMPASCNTSYRVGAHPGKKMLSIEQDAALYQHSGFVWEAPVVFVSTTRRDRTLTPGNPAPWRIQLHSKLKEEDDRRKTQFEPAQAPMEMLQGQVASNKMSLERVAAPPVPQQEEKSTFRLWSLGKQRITEGSPVRVPLSSESYKASYAYTLRPSANPKGFLTAELSLPEALELPPGSAQFFIDDIAVGASPFSFNGDKATIFFGSDPQVTATMRDVKRTTGEQGFINKDQTVLWHWQITLKSTRKHPVDVRVEDPAPDALDTAISVTVHSAPQPEEVINPPQLGGAKIYRWNATLQPGQPQVIDHKVELSAPADKILVPGRGSR